LSSVQRKQNPEWGIEIGVKVKKNGFFKAIRYMWGRFDKGR